MSERVEWVVRWQLAMYWFESEAEARTFVKNNPQYTLTKRTVTEEPVNDA